MSSITYETTVPIFVRGLEQFIAILKIAESWANENGKSADALVQSRIIDDMFPLAFQIKAACNTAGVVPAIFADAAAPVFSAEDDKTFADLYARLEAAIKALRAADKTKFIAPDTKRTVPLGLKQAELPVLPWVQKYAIPNFFFHVATGYDILRQEGVPVGKKDYLGAESIMTWSL